MCSISFLEHQPNPLNAVRPKLTSTCVATFKMRPNRQNKNGKSDNGLCRNVLAGRIKCEPILMVVHRYYRMIWITLQELFLFQLIDYDLFPIEPVYTAGFHSRNFLSCLVPFPTLSSCSLPLRRIR
jgi:hypothetical protein